MRYGWPKIVMARMVFNIAADFAIRQHPFVGALQTSSARVNTRNLRLVTKYHSPTVTMAISGLHRHRAERIDVPIPRLTYIRELSFSNHPFT